MNTTLDIYVTDRGGAYTTNKVRGNACSCTSSAMLAAQGLAQKLFGPALHGVAEVEKGNTYTTKWRITADAEHWAGVSEDGLLHTGLVIGVGHTAVAKGPERALVKVLHGLTGGLFMVPSVAAFAGREVKDEALLLWLRASAKATPPKVSLGVVFETKIRRAGL